MQKDYYNILGVSKDATKEEIKNAYRRLAHKYHPDKKDGDEMKFKEINEAYQILSDDQKRQQYDQFGDVFSSYAQGFRGQAGQHANWEDAFKGFSFQGGRVFDWEDFSDIFDNLFFRAGFRTRKRPKNILVNLDLDLKDALKGIEKEIRLNDLNIRLKIKIKKPKDLSKEEKELIKKMKKNV